MNPQQPSAVDLDNVPETLCCGVFNLSFVAGNLATITFTHPRPKIGLLIASNQIQDTRIVMNLDNLVALRDFLNNAVKDDRTAMASPATGGSGKLN
jgi:hypothetical protein